MFCFVCSSPFYVASSFPCIFWIFPLYCLHAPTIICTSISHHFTLFNIEEQLELRLKKKKRFGFWLFARKKKRREKKGKKKELDYEIVIKLGLESECYVFGWYLSLQLRYRTESNIKKMVLKFMRFEHKTFEIVNIIGTSLCWHLSTWWV